MGQYACYFLWLRNCMKMVFSQKANETKVVAAWGLYLKANDGWKDAEAQKKSKAEIKVHV